MQIQSINNAQHHKRQNFGAHFNFTKTGKKFVSDLAQKVHLECITTPYSKVNYANHTLGSIKKVDEALDKDMVITLDKFKDNKYHGTLSKGPYKTDFEFENCLEDNGLKGNSYDQITSMGSALKRAAENLRDSGKDLVESLGKRLGIKS